MLSRDSQGHPRDWFTFAKGKGQVLAAGEMINTSLCLLQTAQVCVNETLVRSFWLLCSVEALGALQGWILTKPPDDYGRQEKPAHILS